MPKPIVQLIQPRGSKLCGQFCIAMLTGRPVEEIIKTIGHSRGTNTRTLANVLRQYGYIAPIRLRRLNATPTLAIAKQPHVRGNGWHWVLIYDGVRYDPAGVDSPGYGSRLSSYLPISRLEEEL